MKARLSLFLSIVLIFTFIGCSPPEPETSDTKVPTVSITYPPNGATVSGTFTIKADATDNNNEVAKVEFYIDGTLKSTDISSPYEYSWNTTTYINGFHTIMAKAYDATNNVGSSSVITVIVNNESAEDAVLLVSPTSLDFGTSSTSNIFTISNSGGGILSWNVSESVSWITSVSPISGTTNSGTVTVQVSRIGLIAGTYNGTVSVTSTNGGDQDVSVSMTVLPPDVPVLLVSPTSLYFGTSSTSMTFTISNAGGGTLSWDVSENPDESWITSVLPASGTNGETITVQASRSGLIAGTYNGTVSVTSTNGGDQDVSVSMTVEEEPTVIEISVSPSSLNFESVTVGQYSDKTVNITNSSSSTANLTGNVSISGTDYSIISGSGLYNLSPGDSKTITVRFSPFSSGTKSGSLSITHNATNSSSPISVSLTGIGEHYIEISVSPSSLNFESVTVDQYSDKTVNITNSSSSTANLTGNVSISGTYYSIISGSRSYNLSPGDSKTITVRFSPSGTSSLGTNTGSLYVYHNGNNYSSPITVSLAGTGESKEWKGYTNKDAYVDEGFPTTNYGLGSPERVGNFGSSSLRALIGFDFANVISESPTIISAKLRVYVCYDYNTPFYVRIGWINQTWSETSVTWDNQPDFTYHTDTNFQIPSTFGYLIFDVTNEVQKMVNYSLNNGFIIRASDESGDKSFEFLSRETTNSSTYRPYLVIEYVP